MDKSNLPVGGQKLIVIVGPTASGKSDLGIKIAKKFGGEIISADSRQVYRGMDIGTGKVTKKEQKMARHHLIDIASPKKQFTASDFNKLGQKALIDIASRSKIPIIVGGTGFYIDVLLGRMQTAEVPPNKKLRAQLEHLTTEKLFENLNKLDPERAKNIDSRNRRRLIRALEIINTLGKVPFPNISTSQVEIFWLGLRPKNLEKIIKKRLDKRLKKGMIKEVNRLHRQGVSWKRLNAFGLEYRWVALYLQNKIPYEEMGEKLLRDIIHYSKRQMTWFKRNKKIHWFTLNRVEGIKNLKGAERAVSTFLQKTAH